MNIGEFGDQDADLELGEPAELQYIENDELCAYIVQVVALLTGEADQSLVSGPLSIASDSLNIFIKDQQSPIFVINRLVQNDDIADEPEISYAVNNEVQYNEDQNLAVIFVKKEPVIDANKPICDQLDVMKLSNFDTYPSFCAQLDNLAVALKPFGYSARDPNGIQSTEQFGINNLDLALKAKLQKNMHDVVAFVPTQAELDGMQLVNVVIPEVESNGLVYSDVVIKVKEYPHKTPRSDGRHYSKIYICPFENNCSTSCVSFAKIKKHIEAHCCSPTFYCLFCKHGSFDRSRFELHLNLCAPCLNGAQIEEIIELSRNKTLLFADCRKALKFYWNPDGGEEILQGLDGQKINSVKRYYPRIFTDTPISFHTEFYELIDSLCHQENPNVQNPAIAYIVFELEADFQMNDYDKQTVFCLGRYVGSLCSVGQILVNNHRVTVSWRKTENSRRFCGYVRTMKKLGSRFLLVPVVEGIIGDSAAENVWIRPRFAIEHALKCAIAVLSDKTFNLNAISMDNFCEFRNWTPDRIVIFGFWLLEHCWPQIVDELRSERNLI